MSPHPTEAWNVTEEEWPADGSAEEKLRYLLRWAILAPSSHNTQPWLFRFVEERVEIHPDLRRSLAVVDPEDRELVMSCGTLLFHLRVALRRFGHGGDVRTVTREEREHYLAPVRSIPEVLASVGLGASHEPTADETELFDAIPKRHTNRRAFEDRPVREEVLEQLEAAAEREGGWLETVTDPKRKEGLAEIIAEGDRRQGADPSFRRELAAWIHPSRTWSRDGMPGHALDMSGLASYLGPFLVRTFDWGDRRAAENHELAEGSPIMAVLGTRRDTPAGWLNAGEALDRVLLRATAQGLSASFLNQPLEMADLRSRVEEVVGRDGTPQIILRLGYGPGVEAPTPRRPLEEMVIERE